ncbi:MAG TPA: sugar kinase [Chitinophagaceae bacterium]|nr:sugar kinase [Chitinophagaceae bacterium]
MKKVFCFGELLLRLSPQLNSEWIKQSSMPVYIGGAELNVATALARWNVPVSYCTSLPDNYLSKEIVDSINEKGVETDKINFSGNRIGIYYLPQGADLKNAGVIYDRAYSSFSELKPEQINWSEVLQGVSWLHVSAISPALNENVAAVCLQAVKIAKGKSLTVSIDLNYRAKLWQYGKEPHEIMPEILQHCDVVMGNIWAAESLLGIASTLKESKGKTKEELIDAAGKSMKQIHISYPKVSSIAYTFRLEKSYFGLLQHGPERAISKEFLLENIIDQVGSGDCFMGGLIYGLYNQHRPKEIIDFAAAAAVSKLYIKGDATTATVEEIKKEYLNYA